MQSFEQHKEFLHDLILACQNVIMNSPEFETIVI